MTDQALRRADLLLTELVELVETARAMPMSSSCVLPREHVLDLLDGLRDVLPPEMDEARRLVAQRDTVLVEASGYAERIRDEADRDVAAARAELEAQAATIIAEAREQAAAMRAEAELTQQQTLEAAQLRARAELEAGRAEHARLVASTGVHQAAESVAQRLRNESEEQGATIRADAQQYAKVLREEAAGYAERTLSDLIEVLQRATATTEHGRLELARRRSAAGD